MARKKLSIDSSLCIGCCACVGSYPDDFTLGAAGTAELINGEGEEEAVDICPGGAISVAE